MFIKNCWYVAAEPQEIAPGELLARTLLGEDVVLYRSSDGVAGALEDRCPHRFAALSGGKVIDDCVQCPYHGARYDRTGKCVSVPGQTGEHGMRVTAKHYPIIERYNYVWIWMGDPRLAKDESSIPDWFAPASPDNKDWKGRHNKILSMPAYYELICDNLNDITHTQYVHPETLGAELLVRLYRLAKGEANDQMHMEQNFGEYSMRSDYYLKDVQAGPIFHQMLAYKLGQEQLPGNVDWTLTVRYQTPAMYLFHPRTKVAGASESEEIAFYNLNAVTPETETSTHYFYYTANNLKSTPEREATFTALVADGIDFAFNQDKALISAQMKRVPDKGHSLDSMTEVSFMGDMIQIMGRKMIRKQLAAEQAERLTAAA